MMVSVLRRMRVLGMGVSERVRRPGAVNSHALRLRNGHATP
jgi:hypothetical protein